MVKKSYIIFDFDETIGQFIQLGHFYRGLVKYFNRVPTKYEFYTLLNKCDKYFRPNMFGILNYIKKYKMSNDKLKVIIYTNNQGGKQWVSKIKDFMELKIEYNLFDRIIGPHKIKEELYEILRSSEKKRYDDLVKIIDCNDNEDILFIDDSFYNDMIKDNVVYLLVKPYKYYYKTHELIEIYLSYNKIDNRSNFIEYMTHFMSLFDSKKSKSHITNEDIETSNDILTKIKDFLFKSKNNKSHKRTVKIYRHKTINKTMKKR